MIARNTLINLLGQVLPLLVAVIAIPFVVQGLGTDRFGLLSLAWVIMGYFTIFDLGLGRATTKYVAEALGIGKRDQIPRIIWNAVTVQTIFGAMGSIILVGIAPFLLEHVLNIPTELIGEAKSTFNLLALAIPVVLVTGSFQGSLEATQRFDLINIVRAFFGALNFVLPVIGLRLGFGLPGIVAMILISRLVMLLVFISFNFEIFPGLKKFSPSFELFSSLFAYGGWVMISNAISPFLRYLDRIMLGAFLSLSAVTYYSIPYDVMDRLAIFPVSLVMTLFPVFSMLNSTGNNERTQLLLLRSSKYLIILMSPIIFGLIVFAQPILEIWLGNQFAEQSTLTFQILAAAEFIALIAAVPNSIIQGYGRPDIIAKLYIMYIPLNIALVWILIKNLGLPGAALSFALRNLLDIVIVYYICMKIISMPVEVLFQGLKRAIISIFILGSLLLLLFLSSSTVIFQVIAYFSISIVFGFIIWYWVLDNEDTLFKELFSRRMI